MEYLKPWWSPKPGLFGYFNYTLVSSYLTSELLCGEDISRYLGCLGLLITRHSESLLWLLSL